jgi:hypothetical protein
MITVFGGDEDIDNCGKRYPNPSVYAHKNLKSKHNLNF